jgi:hypothetical protein
MNTIPRFAVLACLLGLGVAAAHPAQAPLVLTGAQEVPPVATEAKGSASIVIGADKSVRGSIRTTGIAGIAAHIHLGEVGQNGPPIITLTKASDDEWIVPADATLTDEQYAAFRAGRLYVNVHSDAHRPGEIRTQLKP